MDEVYWFSASLSVSVDPSCHDIKDDLLTPVAQSAIFQAAMKAALERPDDSYTLWGVSVTEDR
jgi:hypothetical protein